MRWGTKKQIRHGAMGFGTRRKQINVLTKHKTSNSPRSRSDCRPKIKFPTRDTSTYQREPYAVLSSWCFLGRHKGSGESMWRRSMSSAPEAVIVSVVFHPVRRRVYPSLSFLDGSGSPAESKNFLLGLPLLWSFSPPDRFDQELPRIGAVSTGGMKRLSSQLSSVSPRSLGGVGSGLRPG
jgi:hypothetical protein